MRRIDVWVGRCAAVAGLLYVTIASLWPLTASGAVEGHERLLVAIMAPGRASIDAFSSPSTPPSTPADVRLAGVIADVTVTRKRRVPGRWVAASQTIGTTSESQAMLLIAAGLFGAALTTTLARTRWPVTVVA